MLCSALWMTEVSFTYLSHNFGGWVALLMAFVSNFSMNRFATVGLIGGSHGSCMHLFIILTLEEETGVFKAELAQCYDVLY